MAYTPENNPYIPGDPYSYDLKWVVDEIDKWKTSEDAVEEATRQAGLAKDEADRAKDEADRAKDKADDAADSASDAHDSELAAKDYADHIADPVSGLVTDWLNDHITQPTTPAIDTSLSVSGAAADAAVVGDRLAKIETAVVPYNIADFHAGNFGGIPYTNEDHGTYTLNGSVGGATINHIFQVPAGTYKANRTYISGTPSGNSGIQFRYGTGYTFMNDNTEYTFTGNTDIYIVLPANTVYTDYKIKLTLVDVNADYTAIDIFARDDIDNIDAIQKTTTGYYNLVNFPSQEVYPLTVERIGIGRYKVNGTNDGTTKYITFELPAGTYRMLIKYISGSPNTANTVVFRYGTGYTFWSPGTTVTFTGTTEVFFNMPANIVYSDCVVDLTIYDVNDAETALDRNAREDVFNIYNILENYLFKADNLLKLYAVETCINKCVIDYNSISSILLFGDSIAAGAWPGYFETLSGKTIVNKAVPGALYGESVRTSAYWASTQIAGVSAAEWSATDLVIMAFGTNDGQYSTPENELKTKVQAALTDIRSNTTAPILFITPIRCGKNDSPAEMKLPVISGIIANVALANGESVLNGFDIPIPSSTMGEIDSFLADGLHPNSTGAYVYAMALANAIK